MTVDEGQNATVCYFVEDIVLERSIEIFLTTILTPSSMNPVVHI